MTAYCGGLIGSLLVIATIAACDSLPGRPRLADLPVRPSEVRDFAHLYRENCAGCHGSDGRFGAATELDNAVYWALIDDASVQRTIAQGVAGAAMPPFAESAGGSLTDQQIGILVNGMRARWGGHTDLGAGAPSYTAGSAGDANRGAQVYAADCESCHGAEGKGGAKAGSIVDGAYLSLVSDQSLRTLIVAGRPDLGHPDWRGYVAGRPMTSEQVSDVVAWLVSKRPRLRQP